MTRNIKFGFRASRPSDLDLELIAEALGELEAVLRYQADSRPQGPERQTIMGKAQRAVRIMERIEIDLGVPDDK